MRVKPFVEVIIVIAVLLTAITILWEPSYGFSPDIVKSQEINRGVFFDITKIRYRLVAVGEQGRILLSMDDGSRWSVAPTPVNQTLTCVYFLNDAIGWVAGYEGVILKTLNGGLTWECLRAPQPNSPPIFDIWFKDEKNGFAVGADSLVYRSFDGGKHWISERLKIQAHLYKLSRSLNGMIWVVGENRAIFRSDDEGVSWRKVNIPMMASFYGSVGLSSDQILTCGLRGRIAIWGPLGIMKNRKIADETFQSILRLSDGRLVVVGQRGRIAVGETAGWPFQVKQISVEKDITAVAETSHALVFTGIFGIQRVFKKDLGI